MPDIFWSFRVGKVQDSKTKDKPELIIPRKEDFTLMPCTCTLLPHCQYVNTNTSSSYGSEEIDERGMASGNWQ
jgi:hypothetical protein